MLKQPTGDASGVFNTIYMYLCGVFLLGKTDENIACVSRVSFLENVL